MFPDNAPVGLNFRLDLPQAQTISANFSVSVTQLNIGVYMYALRYPCGAGGNITDLLQLSTSGAWSSDNNEGTAIQFTSNRSLYLEATDTLTQAANT